MSDVENKVIKSNPQISEASQTYLAEMVDIATSTSGISDDNFAYLMSDSTANQLKVFLLSLARNELLRVIRLTETLNELEETFVREALENREDMNLGVLSEIMKSIVNSLNRSTDLVYKVMNDESIKLIIDASTNIFNAPDSQSIVILQDAASREKVKKLANDILGYIQKETKKSKGD